MTRTCKYGPCGVGFEPRRPHQVFHSDECRYADWVARRENGDEDAGQRVGAHPLDEVRGLQEEGKTSAEWLAVARIQVERTLLATGYFTADDLAELGIPECYRRSIHGSVTGFYSGQGYMVEAGRRKSERPERKGGKNTVYRITQKGRQELSKLAGVGADNRDGDHAEHAVVRSGPAQVSPDPGESSTGGRGQARKSIGEPASATPGAAAPETLSLLPEPPRLIDPDQRAA